MQQTQTQVTSPNQRNGGLLKMNYQPPAIMSLEELDTYIIYMLQIRRLMVNNNVLRIALNQDRQ